MLVGRILMLLMVVLAGIQAAGAQVTLTGSQIALASGTWSAPSAAAVDGKGNLYIADLGNNRIEELTVSGNGFNPAQTILSGLSSPAGIAADWNGNVFVSDTGNNRILMLPMTSTGFGEAVTIATGLNTPVGLAVDAADNVYVADSGNNRIVELPNVAGIYGAAVTLNSGLNRPMGVAVDANKTLFVADTGNYRILKEVYTAGGYPSQQVFFTNVTMPVGIYVDKSDNLYIADSANKRIMEMTWFAAAGRFQSELVIGTGFAAPAGVATDANGDVYVADSAGDSVTEVTTKSVNFGAVGLGSAGAVITYNFSVAAGAVLGGVSIDTQGISGKDFADAGGSTCLAQTYAAASYCSVNVRFSPLASGLRMGAVELFDPNGNPLASAFISGIGNGPQIAVIPGTATTLGVNLSGPSGVTVDGGGNVYIADTGNNRVVELPWTGSGYALQITLPITGLISPMGLALDAAGDLYIVSNGNDKVVKLIWTGNSFGQQAKVRSGLSGPTGVTVDAVGNVYITDTLDERVNQVAWTGSGYSAEIEMGNYHKSPTGIAVDSNGDIFFSDPYQNSVSEVPWSGTRYGSQIDLSGLQVSFPSALAVDGNSNLYVLDTDNNRVVMLPWTGSAYGKQITVASGFNSPTAIAIGGNDQLFVADTSNNQVVKIDLSTPPQVTFSSTYLGSTSIDSAKIELIENVGNQPLSLGSVTYSQDFPEDPGIVNACTEDTALGTSQRCELAIDFTPQSVGSPLTEAITVTSNSLGATAQQMPLIVTGTSFTKLAQSIGFSLLPAVTYGVAPIALSATASSALPVSFAVVSGPAVLIQSGQVLRVTGAGTVVVEAMQAGNSAYAAAAPVEVSFNVSPATLTVAPANAMSLYGSIQISFSYSITGFVNGDNAFTATTGKPSIVSGAGANANAGAYILAASQGTLSAANYSFSFIPGTFTVAKRPLQVAAISVSHSYGSPMKAFTWFINGYVNGDSASVITGTPTLTSAANSGSQVGTYPILVSTSAMFAANYSFTGVQGTLTVVPAMLTVTGASQSITYGAATPTLTCWISGFMNGDTAADVVQGAAAIATTAVPGSAAGAYPISPSLGTLTAANYTFRFSPGVLTINKAVILVSPANVSMIYGSKLPSLSYNLTGLVNGDIAATAVTGAPALTTTASAASRPGNYTIASSAGTLTSKNYSFSFGSGAVTIAKAVLTVTANVVQMTYGSTVPALTYSFSGFLNGDGSSTVQGAPALTTTATSASPVGSYPVLCAGGTLASQEYTFNLFNGTLAVNKAVISVKAVSVAMTYGGTVPALSYQLTGFVNGDTAAAVSGAALLTTAVAPVSAVGTYPLSVAVGSLSAANYTFTPVNGVVAVNKTALTVTPISQSMTYGSALPVLTYSITGFVNGDSQQTAITGAPALSTTATASSAVGQYPIVPALGNLAATNYSFVFIPAWMKVNRASLTVAANNLAMQAGGTIPTFTYTISGWVNGDTPSVLSGAPALTTSATAASQAGNYTIVAAQGNLKAANYQFILVNGTLVVSQPSANLRRVPIR